jgi:hypothetical protein
MKKTGPGKWRQFVSSLALSWGKLGCRWLTSSVRTLRYLLGQIPQKVKLQLPRRLLHVLPMGTKHMLMTLRKSGVTWQISPGLMTDGPMSSQHNVLMMEDALSSCCGITSLDPTTFSTWLQKQKLSLDRSVIPEKERSGPGRST